MGERGWAFPHHLCNSASRFPEFTDHLPLARSQGSVLSVTTKLRDGNSREHQDGLRRTGESLAGGKCQVGADRSRSPVKDG